MDHCLDTECGDPGCSLGALNTTPNGSPSAAHPFSHSPHIQASTPCPPPACLHQQQAAPTAPLHPPSPCLGAAGTSLLGGGDSSAGQPGHDRHHHQGAAGGGRRHTGDHSEECTLQGSAQYTRAVHQGSRLLYTKNTIDPTTSFFFTPRTLTLLFAGLAALVHYAHVLDPSDGPRPAGDAAGNTKNGVWAAICVFLGYSVVQGPRTSMVRPHPGAWRLVHGGMVVYTLFLVWLLFQDVGDARLFMRHLSPRLGVPVDARSYAADCRLYVRGAGVNWAGVVPTLLDEFVLAHFLGWWAKALVLRNYTLLWVISVLFEALELTLQHMLPNFNECWWDRWVLDVAVCNLLGIVAGMATVRWFECKYEQYNWQGLSQLPTLGAKARRSFAQLLPYSWDKFTWMAFSSPKRFLQALFVVMLVLSFELNAFFLKHALWVPSANPLNTARLLVWFLCGLPAVREYYEYVEGRAGDANGHHKLGTFAWLAIAMTCLETCVSHKFGHGLYPTPAPARIRRIWGGALGALALALAGWQASLWLRRWRRRLDRESSKSVTGDGLSGKGVVG